MSGTSLGDTHGSRVKDDDKGNGAALSGLDPTFVTMKGLRNHKLAWIGANGIGNGVMVLRMRSVLGRDAGHCRLQPRTRFGYRNIFGSTGNNCYSHLDEAREPSGAIRDPRGRPQRRPTCPDGLSVGSVHFPVRERG